MPYVVAGLLTLRTSITLRDVPLAWLLVFNAVVVGSFGVIAVLFPGPLYDSFGGTSDVGSQFVVQLAGAASILCALPLLADLRR